MLWRRVPETDFWKEGGMEKQRRARRKEFLSAVAGRGGWLSGVVSDDVS
jgi:hypothetical protein